MGDVSPQIIRDEPIKMIESDGLGEEMNVELDDDGSTVGVRNFSKDNTESYHRTNIEDERFHVTINLIDTPLIILIYTNYETTM